MIIVGGDEVETQALAADYRMLLADEGGEAGETKGGDDDDAIVLIPTTDETIDASVETNEWEVVISDALYRTLQWQTIRSGLRVATIKGQLRPPADPSDEIADEEVEVSKAKKAKTSASDAGDKDKETAQAPAGP